ncbi:MAG: hypothetical protein LRZ87_00785, partial [Methanocellales archaeon]|nr:hypothetical protein [Methanocellales archaeon]
FQRADRSGTEDVFAEDILGLDDADQINATIAGKTGNAGVFAAVRDTPNSIGFVDLGFVTPDVTESTAGHLRESRPLNLITNGAPSPLEQAFLDFARSPGAIQYFHKVGMTSIVELN